LGRQEANHPKSSPISANAAASVLRIAQELDRLGGDKEQSKKKASETILRM
jgi:hypothetical protein